MHADGEGRPGGLRNLTVRVNVNDKQGEFVN